MAHQSLTPADHGPYYEGDAIHIPVQIFDKNGDQPVNITGGHAELLAKGSRTDPDTEALLNKSTDVAGEGEMTTPEDGEVEFYIDTDDTDGFLTDDGFREEDGVFFVIVRFYDAEGNRVGVVEADWEVTAS